MNSGYTLTFANSGSDDIEDDRNSIEFTKSAKNTQKISVSLEAYQAVKDVQSGKISPEEGHSVLRKERIHNFFLSTKIIGQYTKETPEVSKKTISKQKKQKKKASKKASKKRKMRRMKLRDNSPLMVPFNCELNDGAYDECVIRAIKPAGYRPIYPGETKRKYTGTTADDLIDYCEEIQRPLSLYDITGRIFYKNEYTKLKDYPGVIGLCHDEHLYIAQGKSIKLNTETVYTEPESGYVEYTRGNHTITSGVHKEKDQEFIDIELPQGSFNCATQNLLKAGVSALGYSKNSSTENGYTIDCNKCYYSTATEGNYILNYGIFSIFDEFKKYQGQVIDECSFYIISANATKYGVTTNVVGGRTLKALRALGVVVIVSKVLEPSSKNLWEHSVIIKKFNDHKAFNKYNGMCGKTEANGSTSIRITNGREREYLLEDHPDFEASSFDPEVIVRSFEFKKVSGYLHRYLAVVDGANARVLSMISKIGQEVIKIKTDSLTYANSVPVPIGWKTEEFKPCSFTSNGNVFEHNLEKIKYTRNICYLGAPGTGKSYIVKKEHKYDYASTFTNKSALNCSVENGIKGETLHSLFNLESTKKFFHLQDKTVWIDEISMIPRWIWAYILEAYLNLNTTFIFSGDFNQTSPVAEDPLYSISFLGKITTLTKDYRNCEGIIAIREQILAGEAVKYELSTGKLPLTNIAYTNNTVTSVNARVVAENSFVWGGVGTKVIAKETIKKLGIAKNQSYIIKNRTETQTFLERGNGLPNGIFDNSFTWGYCYTVHKAQGDTIDKPLGIHEFSKMSRSIKYTAITRACKLNQIQFY